MNAIGQNVDTISKDIYEHLISKKSAALMIGIHYRTIERWYNQGMLTRFRMGGRFYFDIRAIQTLAASPEPREVIKSERFQLFMETLRK